MSPKAKLAVKLGAGVAAILLSSVATHEGLRLSAYRDLAGVPTICYGETLGVKMGDTATREQCDQKLAERILEFAEKVDDCVKPPMPPHVHAAYTSFAYNVGINGFCGSTMAKLANQSRFEESCGEFQRWVYVKKKDCRDPANKCAGIVKRRVEEERMCRGG